MSDAGHVPGTVSLQVEGAVALLTLSRPGRRNAWGSDMTRELLDHLAELGQDDSIRACVLTGADAAFSSGADLGDRQAHVTTSAGDLLRGLDPHRHAIFGPVMEFRKPLIAAIAGPAVGLGFALALCCDVILVGESARMALPNTRLGIVVTNGALGQLAQRVGRSRALDIGWTGRVVDAAEAVAIGLAVARHPDDMLQGAALDYARVIASYPPLAVWAAKESLDTALEGGSPRIARLLDAYRLGLLQMTEDSHEAHVAWRERREPDFRIR